MSFEVCSYSDILCLLHLICEQLILCILIYNIENCIVMLRSGFDKFTLL